MFLEFVDGDTSNAYEVKIRGTDEDNLMIWQETAFYHKSVSWSGRMLLEKLP